MDVVTFNIAMGMKSIGFNEPCSHIYQKNKNVKICGTKQLYNWTKLKSYHDIQYHKKNSANVIGCFGNECYMPLVACCVAPTWNQAFKWFRLEYMLYVTVHIHTTGFSYNIEKMHKGELTMIKSTIIESLGSGLWFDTYEDAQEAALLYLIKMDKK